MDPAVFPILAQSFSTFPTSPRPNSPQREPNTFNRYPAPPLAETYHFPGFAQKQPELEDIFPHIFRRPVRLSSWRIREIERQREMDRIAEPYLARLREVSRQKKAQAEARALAGKQKEDQANGDRRKSRRGSLREDEKKAMKELTEVKRQQRSEERRQLRKNTREKRRHSKSGENPSPEGLERSSRRQSPGRSKPYSIPHPETRSPRRSCFMPGGFDSGDLTQDCQTSFASDVDAFWKCLRSAVDVGYRFWTRC